MTKNYSPIYLLLVLRSMRLYILPYFLYLKNVEGDVLKYHRVVSGSEHYELPLTYFPLYLDENDNIYCFITFFRLIFQRKTNFLTFKEKL